MTSIAEFIKAKIGGAHAPLEAGRRIAFRRIVIKFSEYCVSADEVYRVITNSDLVLYQRCGDDRF
jgi:hypothetical protein